MMNPALEEHLTSLRELYVNKIAAIDLLFENGELQKSPPPSSTVEKVATVKRKYKKKVAVSKTGKSSWRTDDEKRAIVDRIETSIAGGDKTEDACENEGISVQTLYNYRNHLKGKKPAAKSKKLSFSLKKEKKSKKDPYAEKPEPNPVTGEYD